MGVPEAMWPRDPRELETQHGEEAIVMAVVRTVTAANLFSFCSVCATLCLECFTHTITHLILQQP